MSSTEGNFDDSFAKNGKSLFSWLVWFEKTRPEHKIDYELDRIKLVGQRLDLLKPAPFTITVGGTNGKGSTLAVLESVLLAGDYKVGLFTSPHLLKFNERIRINGQNVCDEWLCHSFEKINNGRQSTWLTYFEFVTLAAIDCFQKGAVDIALMEVGMGGRQDATNVVDPDISILTTVALDHQEYLGDSIEAIAKEKSGIFRKGKPVVFGDRPVPCAVSEMADYLQCPFYCPENSFSINRTGNVWTWIGRENQQLENLPVPNVILDNAATAIQALQLMPHKIELDAIKFGLSQVALPGRFQKRALENGCGELIEVVFDVAHNPQAAKVLKHRLDEFPVDGKTRVIFAMCKDKDYMAFADCLKHSVDEWYVTQFDSPRALPGTELSIQLEQHGYLVTRFESVQEGLQCALECSEAGDRVLVTGAFMTVADGLNYAQ